MMKFILSTFIDDYGHAKFFLLKRCTVGKTIALEKIEDIMFDCKKHDLEMELKSITK